jgi:hypothetical protein
MQFGTFLTKRGERWRDDDLLMNLFRVISLTESSRECVEQEVKTTVEEISPDFRNGIAHVIRARHDASRRE